jgi:hypothetical protein
MTNGEAWKKGFIDGYQSARSNYSLVPPTPSCPASVPAGVRDTKKYYYRLGYEHGREKGQ